VKWGNSLAFVESLHCCLPLLVFKMKHSCEVSHVCLQTAQEHINFPTTNSLVCTTFSMKAVATPTVRDQALSSPKAQPVWITGY